MKGAFFLLSKDKPLTLFWIQYHPASSGNRQVFFSLCIFNFALSSSYSPSIKMVLGYCLALKKSFLDLSSPY